MNALTNLRLNLKRFRKAQGLTQERIAEWAGLDFRHYQRIETGKWPGLQLHTVESLAKVLKVEVYQLFMPTVPHERGALSGAPNQAAVSRLKPKKRMAD